MAAARKPTKAQQQAHDAAAARARALGMQIRYARSIKSPGAICQVKERLVLFVKRTLELDEQTSVMESELDRFERLGMKAVRTAAVPEEEAGSGLADEAPADGRPPGAAAGA